MTEPVWTTAWIALGANLGDRLRNLKQAIARMHAHPAMTVEQCSPVYETDPVGVTDQPPFLNMVVRIQTSLPAEELLDCLLGIERELGRVRDKKWGPRTLDLDILLYGDLNMASERLAIPHPHLEKRLFMLIPLLDVISADTHSQLREKYSKMVKKLIEVEGREGVRRWSKADWPDVFGHSAN